MTAQYVIIGGGIAGLSLASELAERTGEGKDVLVVEAEDRLAHHTSARSAQQLIPSYGPDPVLELTRLSIPVLLDPPAPATRPLAWPSHFLMVGGDRDVDTHMAPGMRRLWREDVVGLCPELSRRPERYVAGALDESSVRTDAAALVAWHRERAQRAGVRIAVGTRVSGGCFERGAWTLVLDDRPQEILRSRVVVDAAGAWADAVATSLGARPQKLTPLRRTAAYVGLEEPMPPEHPMVNHASEEWYYRPEGRGAMISWGEAEPSAPCDAQPHEGSVDALIDLLHRETALTITGVRRAWTGLRTETPHDVPLCGWDHAAENFLWLAGQGGYGFQTSPAMARAATDLLVDGEVGDWLSTATVEALRPTL